MKKIIYDNIIVVDNEMFLICPICGKLMKALHMHILEKHPEIEFDIFKKNYPLCRLQLFPEKKLILCPYCNKEVRGNAALAAHIKKIHGIDVHLKWKADNNISDYNKIINTVDYPVCAICGKKTIQICQHVRLAHKIKWDEYCEKYNYSGPKTYFSKSHNESLSTNKIKYYNSDRGLLERKRLSDRYSGDKNPSRRRDVREKISRSAIKRMQDPNNKFMNGSYGIKVTFKYDNVKYSTRSFFEYSILLLLLTNGIKFEYEPKINIRYLSFKNGEIFKRYQPDLLIDNNIIELKPNKKHKSVNVQKYNSIKNMIDKIGTYNFMMCDMNDICSIFNIKNDNRLLYTYAKEQLDSDNMKLIIRSYHPRSQILNKIGIDKNHPNIDYRLLTKKDQ